MPQPSYPYACARISALEKGLLDEATIRRMAEGSLEDAMRTLLDARYGAIPDATAADCERMIENERRRASEEIRALSPDPALTDLFLMQCDVHNLKVLLKARLLGTVDVEWEDGGLFPRERLSRMVQEQDYRELPQEMQQELDALERRLKIAVEPQRISVALDRGYLAYALRVSKGSKEAFIQQYFSALADFDNILTFLRMRAMGAPREDMRDMLLPEGGIQQRALLDAYELSYDALTRVLSESVARAAITRGLNEMARTGRIGALEKERDDYLMLLVKSHRYERMTIFPIVGYLFAREREAKAVRLILTVKRNGLDDAVIQERLRELYG